MAWPPTFNITPALLAQGVTTIYWGTEDLLGYYVVLSFHQRELVENVRLRQGSGLTSTRVQLRDGVNWDIHVRDDSRMTPPQAGTMLTVVDAAGLLGSRGATYVGRVIESSTNLTSQNPLERNVIVEKLRLITES